MADPLRSLQVTGFRALRHIHIPRLADVNLIVGKNSTGKTTVLEALRLLFTNDLRLQLYNLLADRDEWAFKRWSSGARLQSADAAEIAAESLFSGRPDFSDEPEFVIEDPRLGPGLLVRFVWLRQERGDDASLRYVRTESPDNDPDAIPGLQVFSSRRPDLVLPFDRLSRLTVRRSTRDPAEAGSVLLKSSGMSLADIGRMWDSVALTDDEDDVVGALQIITPSLEKLVMVASPDRGSERMLMAKVREFQSPVPFKSLGEGANHLLSVALGVIQARGATLLIDEIASGIHYSVQPMLWDLVLRQAARHQTQVFATTHSWDCVRALHRAGANHSHASVMLHRLEKRNDITRVVSFDASELAIADQEEIEVR